MFLEGGYSINRNKKNLFEMKEYEEDGEIYEDVPLLEDEKDKKHKYKNSKKYCSWPSPILRVVISGGAAVLVFSASQAIRFGLKQWVRSVQYSCDPKFMIGNNNTVTEMRCLYYNGGVEVCEDMAHKFFESIKDFAVLKFLYDSSWLNIIPIGIAVSSYMIGFMIGCYNDYRSGVKQKNKRKYFLNRFTNNNNDDYCVKYENKMKEANKELGFFGRLVYKFTIEEKKINEEKSKAIIKIEPRSYIQSLLYASVFANPMLLNGVGQWAFQKVRGGNVFGNHKLKLKVKGLSTLVTDMFGINRKSTTSTMFETFGYVVEKGKDFHAPHRAIEIFNGAFNVPAGPGSLAFALMKTVVDFIQIISAPQFESDYYELSAAFIAWIVPILIMQLFLALLHSEAETLTEKINSKDNELIEVYDDDIPFNIPQNKNKIINSSDRNESNDELIEVSDMNIPPPPKKKHEKTNKEKKTDDETKRKIGKEKSDSSDKIKIKKEKTGKEDTKEKNKKNYHRQQQPGGARIGNLVRGSKNEFWKKSQKFRQNLLKNMIKEEDKRQKEVNKNEKKQEKTTKTNDNVTLKK